MKLEQLHHLLEAVKYKSMSIAAENNFMTQPAFSSSITKLEKELGILLLKRTNKGVHPTAIGNEIIRQAQEVLDLIDQIKITANSYNSDIVINLSTIPSICDSLLPDVLANIKESNFPININIHTGEPLSIINRVQQGLSDLGIIIHTDNLEHTGLTYQHLFSDEYVLYVGKSSPLADKPSISMAEALAQPHIAYKDEFYKDNGGLTRIIRKYGNPSISLRTDDNEIMKRLISRNIYVAFFPKFMAKNDIYLDSGLIMAKPINDFDLSIDIGYIENSKFKSSLVDATFLDYLRNYVVHAFDHKSPTLENSSSQNEKKRTTTD